MFETLTKTRGAVHVHNLRVLKACPPGDLAHHAPIRLSWTPDDEDQSPPNDHFSFTPTRMLIDGHEWVGRLDDGSYGYLMRWPVGTRFFTFNCN